jgi:hypothetical protein
MWMHERDRGSRPWRGELVLEPTVALGVGRPGDPL